MISFISNTFQCDFIYFKYISIRFHLFQIHFKLLHWQFSLSDVVCRLEQQLERVMDDARYYGAELARTTARLERSQERNAMTMAETATMAAELEDAAITIKGQKARKTELLRQHAELTSQNSALRQQLDMPAADKDHASTQTDPLPSVVTSPSLSPVVSPLLPMMTPRTCRPTAPVMEVSRLFVDN